MCFLSNKILLSGVIFLGLSLNTAHAQYDPEEIEGRNRLKLPNYNSEVKTPKGTGQTIHEYYEKHPELRKKASENLPKQIPLYKWVEDLP